MSFQDINIGNCTRNNGVTNGYVRKKRREVYRGGRRKKYIEILSTRVCDIWPYKLQPFVISFFF